MKTAVSIPDDVFEDAERLAERLKTSRSALYSRALKELLARHDDDAVTATMDRVVDAVGDESLAEVRKAAVRTLKRVEW